MRIISGKFKGKPLESPKDDRVRPTTDKVKETIFNVIQWSIADSRVLDLFAGSGALGIEAISRGANEVIFVDNNASSLELVNKNLKKIDGNFKVYRNDFKDALKKIDGKLDLIFVDAPFASINGEKAVEFAMELDLLSENGIIVYEHATSMAFEKEIVEKYVRKTKVMGMITVDFLEKICE